MRLCVDRVPPFWIFTSVIRPLPMSRFPASPLTFDLDQGLLEELESLREQAGATSTSALIRYGVEVFDESFLEKGDTNHRQISVRLTPEMREKLFRLSRKHNISIAKVLRSVVEYLPEKIADFDADPSMPKKAPAKKKGAPKARKVPPKPVPKGAKTKVAARKKR